MHLDARTERCGYFAQEGEIRRRGAALKTSDTRLLGAYQIGQLSLREAAQKAQTGYLISRLARSQRGNKLRILYSFSFPFF
jgi:DNA-directed RNA polymerase alpha subunit